MGGAVTEGSRDEGTGQIMEKVKEEENGIGIASGWRVAVAGEIPLPEPASLKTL